MSLVLGTLSPSLPLYYHDLHFVWAWEVSSISSIIQFSCFRLIQKWETFVENEHTPEESGACIY